MSNLVTSCARCNQKKHTSLKWPPPIEYFDSHTKKHWVRVLIDMLPGLALISGGTITSLAFLSLVFPEQIPLAHTASRAPEIIMAGWAGFFLGLDAIFVGMLNWYSTTLETS